MRNPIAAEEHAALQFDDLASALDAGLPLASLGGDAEAGDEAVHTILRNRGVRLTPSEHACLLAAARSGRIPEVLRERARQRDARAELWRRLVGGLAYPVLLIGMAIAVSLLLAPLYGRGLPIGLALAGAGIAAGAFFVRRGFRYGGDAWLSLPVLGPIGHALGEITYLETLHGAYAAGIPIHEAHATATAAVGITGVRLRLRRADQLLRNGAELTAALTAAGALHAETMQLLATGERAGTLEEALHRSLARRRDVTARAVTRLAKVTTGMVYGLGLAVCSYMVIRFWLQYAAALGR